MGGGGIFRWKESWNINYFPSTTVPFKTHGRPFFYPSTSAWVRCFCDDAPWKIAQLSLPLFFIQISHESDPPRMKLNLIMCTHIYPSNLQAQGPSEAFYKSGLMFLAYTPVETLEVASHHLRPPPCRALLSSQTSPISTLHPPCRLRLPFGSHLKNRIFLTVFLSISIVLTALPVCDSAPHPNSISTTCSYLKFSVSLLSDVKNIFIFAVPFSKCVYTPLLFYIFFFPLLPNQHLCFL
jgi:hypothetical protein